MVLRPEQLQNLLERIEDGEKVSLAYVWCLAMELEDALSFAQGVITIGAPGLEPEATAEEAKAEQAADMQFTLRLIERLCEALAAQPAVELTAELTPLTEALGRVEERRASGKLTDLLKPLAEAEKLAISLRERFAMPENKEVSEWLPN